MAVNDGGKVCLKRMTVSVVTVLDIMVGNPVQTRNLR
jgi:hypothetical protein